MKLTLSFFLTIYLVNSESSSPRFLFKCVCIKKGGQFFMNNFIPNYIPFSTVAFN